MRNSDQKDLKIKEVVKKIKLQNLDNKKKVFSSVKDQAFYQMRVEK